MLHYKATRLLLTTDLVILNHGQVTRTTTELSLTPQATTQHQWENFEVQQIWHAPDPLHDESSVSSGLEPVTINVDPEFVAMTNRL
ncbi:hypothetical protein TNCV_3073931 [Trichonephila clavipes]|nr:hypothetical protein TNCV_3073931 [Trichonephila clavipes]